MKYRLLAAALDDLDDIDAWLSEHYGLNFATRQQLKLFSDFDLIAEFPHLGRMRKNFTSEPVLFLPSNPYFIVYSLGSPILIHRILHTARELAPLLNRKP